MLASASSMRECAVDLPGWRKKKMREKKVLSSVGRDDGGGHSGG